MGLHPSTSTSSIRRNTYAGAFAAFTMLAVLSIAGCKSNPAPSPESSAAPQPAPAAAPLPSAGANHPASTRPATPYTTKHIYIDNSDPNADIAAALKLAKHDHKRIILDFGGDWCGDCQVLDIYFHQQPNVDLLDKHFLVVHVWIGREDHNLDVAAKYKVPLDKGVPALAVLDAKGKVLYSQETGEFEDMRHMDASSVTDFLNRWKS